MDSVLDGILRRIRIWKIKPHLHKDAVLCDIGCGSDAQLLREISSYIKEGIGIDKNITEKHDGNLTLKNIFLDDKIPLPNQHVDVVTLLAVLEHLERPVEILREARRILKSGGTLIITVPTLLNPPFGAFLSIFDKDMRAHYKEHKRYYSKALLRSHLRDAGFDLERANLNYFELGMNLFAKVMV